MTKKNPYFEVRFSTFLLYYILIKITYRKKDLERGKKSSINLNLWQGKKLVELRNTT